MKKPRSSTSNATSKNKVSVTDKKSRLMPSSNNRRRDSEESNRWHSLHSLREFKEIEMNNLNIDKLIHKD